MTGTGEIPIYCTIKLVVRLGPAASLIPGSRWGLSGPFDVAVTALVLKPAFFGSCCRTRFPARFRPLSRLTNQSHKPFSGILAISFLTAKPSGINNDYTLFGDPPPCQPNEPITHILGQ